MGSSSITYLSRPIGTIIMRSMQLRWRADQSFWLNHVSWSPSAVPPSSKSNINRNDVRKDYFTRIFHAKFFVKINLEYHADFFYELFSRLKFSFVFQAECLWKIKVGRGSRYRPFSNLRIVSIIVSLLLLI